MKNSITFIMSFIASVTAFSPFAVAGQTNFPKYAEAGKHCEFNKPDHKIVLPKQEVQQQKGSGPTHKAQS